MYRIMAGLVGVTAVAVLAAGVIGNSSVPGVASPVGEAELRAAVLAACDFPDTTIRPGAMVRDIWGGYSVIVTTADGRLGYCTNGFDGNTARSMESEPPKVVGAKISRTTGHGLSWSIAEPIGYTAVGFAAADVARVEILMPDGRVVTATAREGTFAYTVEGFDVETLLTITGRAFNAAGDVIYEGPVRQLPPN